MFKETENPFDFNGNIVCCSAVFSFDLINSDLKFRLPRALDQTTEKRKAEYLASRLCAEKALDILTPGTKKTSVFNAPDRSPVWPDKITGSLTHSGNFTSTAVALKQTIKSIGIDSEEIISEEVANEVCTIVLSPSELARFSQHWSQKLLVTTAFSAKESIFKCLYPLVNKFFGFNDAEILTLDRNSGVFQAVLKTKLDDDFIIDYPLNGHLKITPTYVHTALILK